MAYSKKKTPFFERTPHHCGHADFILNTFPNACFIHLILDGRGVGASLLRISKSWGAYWAPNTLKGAIKMRKWRVQQDLKIFQFIRSSDQYIEVKYEDLRKGSHKHLSVLFEWLGLPIDEFLIDLVIESNNLKNMIASNKVFPSIPKWNEKNPKKFFGSAKYKANDFMLNHIAATGN
jgi:hypothetical protein